MKDNYEGVNGESIDAIKLMSNAMKVSNRDNIVQWQDKDASRNRRSSRLVIVQDEMACLTHVIKEMKMKTFRVPVSQNVEVILADVFVNVDINLREQMPIKTDLGKHAFRQFQERLNYIAHRLANEIMNELYFDGSTSKNKD